MPSKQKQKTKGTRKRKGGKITAGFMKKLVDASHNAIFHDIDDYKIDRSLSNKWVRVYYNKEKNHCVIAHRGSEDMYDAIVDLGLVVDYKKNDRFKVSFETQQKAIEKYGADRCTSFGSSLGAYLAEEVSQKFPVKEIITVGKPTTPADLVKGKKVPDNQYDVSTKSDFLTLLKPLQKGKNDIRVKSKYPYDLIKSHVGDEVAQNFPPSFPIGDHTLGGDGLKKMKVKELKAFAKKLGKARRQKVLIHKKKKPELMKIVNDLMVN